MLTIGSTVNNYRIEKIMSSTVFAVNSNPECPQPYVVWDLDNDTDGVNNGRYFSYRNPALSKFYGVIADKRGE